MKKNRLTISLFLIVAMLFSACASTNGNVPATDPTDSAPTTVTDPTVTDPTDSGSTTATDPVSTEATGPVSTSATDPVSTQPTDPPATQPTTPPATQPTTPPATQPTTPPATQPTTPPATQPTTPPATQPTTPPATQPTTPPATQGSGTQSDPYLIRNLQDLMNLKNVLNESGYYYKQVADIDCSSVGNWIVIGDDDNPFRHHYDGNGYTISNLCLDGDAHGLFSQAEGSQFKNIKIVNAYKSEEAPYRWEIGAIVGYGVRCSFENCSASVSFQSVEACTGGLIGCVVLANEQHTFMDNCHVTGTITGCDYTGGLIGQIKSELADGDYLPEGTILVKNCSANVEIINSHGCIGGLIGEAYGIRIEKCYAKGSVSAISGDIGGLVGEAKSYTDVIRCYAEVDIYASTESEYGGVSAGGLIGHIYSRSDVIDCYATGDINVPNSKWSACQDKTYINGGPWRRYYNPCGSLIGTLEVFRAYSEDQKITVYNCYATGKVNAPYICEDERVYCHSALIGLTLDIYTITNVMDKTKKDQSSWDGFSETYIGHFGNNYNIEDLRTYYSPINDYKSNGTNGLSNPKYTAVPTHDYVEIITEQQLLDQSTFEGWDFVNVWKMTANGPVLR